MERRSSRSITGKEVQNSITLRRFVSPHEMNNIGVAYIDDGSLPRAECCLRMALQSLGREENPWQKSDSSSVSAVQKPLPTTRMGRNIKPLPPSSMDAWISRSSYVGNTSPLLHLHRRGIELPLLESTERAESSKHSSIMASGMAQCSGMRSEGFFSGDFTEDLTIRTSVVVFNLALVYHLKASLPQSGNASHYSGWQGLNFLSKAKRLYQQTYYLLRNTIYCSHSPPYSTGNDLIDLLFMAVLNNLALVESDLTGDLIDANLVLSQLYQFAMSRLHERSHPERRNGTSKDSEENTPFTKFVDEQTRFFLVNAFICGFNNRYTVAAPAA